jgi:hypothetical protein
LELVVEIRHRSQSLDDGGGSYLDGEISQKPIEAFHTNVGKVAGDFDQHGLSLFRIEEGLHLMWVADNRHDDLAEVTGSALNDVEVPIGDRVK